MPGATVAEKTRLESPTTEGLMLEVTETVEGASVAMM